MARPIYKGYNFRGKDPVIDETRTLLEDHFGRRVDYKMLREVHESGGPTVGCLAGWFFGDTSRPNNATVGATGGALGYERAWRRKGRNK
jgi:hypothetical protein